MKVPDDLVTPAKLACTTSKPHNSDVADTASSGSDEITEILEGVGRSVSMDVRMHKEDRKWTLYGKDNWCRQHFAVEQDETEDKDQPYLLDKVESQVHASPDEVAKALFASFSPPSSKRAEDRAGTFIEKGEEVRNSFPKLPSESSSRSVFFLTSVSSLTSISWFSFYLRISVEPVENGRLVEICSVNEVRGSGTSER